jgi:hypothetical protein
MPWRNHVTGHAERAMSSRNHVTGRAERVTRTYYYNLGRNEEYILGILAD